MSMIPGFNANFMGAGGDKQSALMVKRYITIIESMTDKELDSTNIKIFSEHSRIMRLARGSGAAARHVQCRSEAGSCFLCSAPAGDSPTACMRTAHPQTPSALTLCSDCWPLETAGCCLQVVRLVRCRC
jgi:hypothetical protein